MKTPIILALCCSFFAGCRSSDSSSRVPATPESVAKRVEQLNLQHERIEELAVRWPHRSPEFLRAVHTGRAAWLDYLRAEQEQRANFAASGIVLDGEYYRLQDQLIEAFSRQWQQIEDYLRRPPEPDAQQTGCTEPRDCVSVARRASVARVGEPER
jgi:hypothetical protein